MTFFLKEISFYRSLICSCPECQSVDSLRKCSDRSRYHVFTEAESLSKHKLSRNNGPKCFNLGKKKYSYLSLNFVILTKNKQIKIQNILTRF